MHLVSLDVLKMGLYRAVPSLEVDPSAPSDEVGEKMWPLVRAMAENALETGVDCIFEGDMLLPSQVAEFLAGEEAQVRTGFVGYPSIEPARKLAEIRQHSGYPNDWLNEHDAQEILDLVEYGIEYSRFLRDESARYGLEYFDCSREFEQTIHTAVQYLLAKS
jgi:hypothetical protein